MLWRKKEEDRELMLPAEVAHRLEVDVSTGPSFLAPATLRAALGPDTAVTGRLSFTVPTRLDGTLRGEIHATDVLVIGETGFVDGTVRAQNLVILGGVHGDVVVADRVEIGPRGRLMGSIDTRQLIVHEGAKLDGDCRIAPARAANLHVLPPRLTAESEDLTDAAALSGLPD